MLNKEVLKGLHQPKAQSEPLWGVLGVWIQELIDLIPTELFGIYVPYCINLIIFSFYEEYIYLQNNIFNVDPFLHSGTLKEEVIASLRITLQ